MYPIFQFRMFSIRDCSFFFNLMIFFSSSKVYISLVERFFDNSLNKKKMVIQVLLLWKLFVNFYISSKADNAEYTFNEIYAPKCMEYLVLSLDTLDLFKNVFGKFMFILCVQCWKLFSSFAVIFYIKRHKEIRKLTFCITKIS